VFYVFTTEDLELYPRLIVDVYHPDQPDNNAADGVSAVHTSFMLFPETPNGVSPIEAGPAPATFWEGFQAASKEYFDQMYPGCAVQLKFLYCWENGEQIVTTGIVFSQNYG
jgi:hypothetical protein